MRKSKYKNGFTVIETVAALFLLAVCLVAFSQLVVFVTSQRVAEAVRQGAVDQLQNVFEQIAALPAEKLVAMDFDRSDYEATTRRSVPDGRIVFSCEPAETPENASVRTYRFQVIVSWNRGEARPRGEVSLFRLLTLAEKENAE